MIKKVVLSGGTGFVGVYLTYLLVKKGYEVLVLTRTLKPNTDYVSYFAWDVAAGRI
ncbi:MAG: NAD-dependent epimerase/dehydratase family protein, partial [Flavobacterium sp.]